jgi:predicted NBD/HSP70 family sugar kinase
MSTEDPRRAASRAEILRVLRHAGAVSRANLTLRTGLSRATVSSIVAELQAEKLVVETVAGADGARSGGRPPALVRLGRAAGAVAGIDIDRLHIRVAVADLGHAILAERFVPAEASTSAETTMRDAEALLDEALDEAGMARTELLTVGMGLPGPVTAGTGELGSSTILPGWAGVTAHAVMSERLGLPVHVGNDANLGALGEWMWGAGRGRQNVAYLKVSAGIGCGLIIGGTPFHGAGGTAGELGHTLVDPAGPVCRCGNRGCLETIAGTSALLDLLEPRHGRLTMAEAVARAAAGDADCRRVIAGAGATIGSAAANLCNLINPELLIVGGDVAPAGETLLRPLRDALARAAIPSAARDVTVVESELGERAELLGAVALALQSGERARPAVSVAQ